MSFGVLFGQLIKRKRGVEDLSQERLAEIAFGDGFKKTRISELENGRVSKPHAKTVDALVIALNIQNEELDHILNQSPHPHFVDTLIDFFDLRGAHLLDVEVVANRDGLVSFIHDRPWKNRPIRFEYFSEESMLIVLSSGGSRRPAGMVIAPQIAEKLGNNNFIRDIQVDASEPKKVICVDEVPLKFIL